MKQELYDEFVDKYSKSDDKDYGQIQRSNMFSKSTKRTFIILFILLAFGVGIVAGFNVISNSQNQIQNNVTITDSAFSANATITNASNIVPANTSTVKYTKTKKTYNNYKKTNTSSSKSYSSSSSNSKILTQITNIREVQVQETVIPVTSIHQAQEVVVLEIVIEVIIKEYKYEIK